MTLPAEPRYFKGVLIVGVVGLNRTKLFTLITQGWSNKYSPPDSPRNYMLYYSLFRVLLFPGSTSTPLGCDPGLRSPICVIVFFIMRH
jgi:hypothetical protein